MAGRISCRDPAEDWGPVSRLREFDLTPCFEEGVVLSSALVIFVVLAVFRCYALRSFESYPRCRKSRWVLWAKEVRRFAVMNRLCYDLIACVLHSFCC